LIRESNYKAFPPRLEIQPIFYPVLNEQYAVQIAKEWNTKDKASGYVGYVTRFEVDDRYISKFEKKVVGARMHEELWVPAEELAEFNAQIVGNIEVIRAFHSKEFVEGLEQNQSSEWTNFQSMSWSLQDVIKCHRHCELCNAHLCTEHFAKTGTDWSSGYIGNTIEGYQLYICPPCFDCLEESRDQSIASET
jgi:hypothetical protein